MARAAPARATVFASIPVFAITPATAPLSTPPSLVKSFWYSIRTSAVFAGSRRKVSDMTAPR